jgi:predicted CoA-binding protein
MPLAAPDDIRTLLEETRTVALVGASDRPDRASYGVMKALIDHGYEVTPVNPVLVGKSIHGRTVVGALSDVDGPIDLVDIFRNSEAAGEVVDAAIAVGARSVWMQLGVINDAAAERAGTAGLKVVMDHCPKIELARLSVKPIAAEL